jgi:hypothetical protein
VHAFDVHGKLLGSELVEGQYLEAAIEWLLANPNALYLPHLSGPLRGHDRARSSGRPLT